MQMQDYQNKVIWITGASSGIGEATAKALSQQGAVLILSARREKELERVKSECAQTENVHLLPLDLSQYDRAAQWAKKAEAAAGPIDILLNNGGIGQFGRVADTRMEVEQKLFAVNFYAPVALTKVLLPKMEERGRGKIVSIGSIAGKFGQANLAAYSASKAALLLYFESLYQELRSSPVEVQVISPGFIRTAVTLNSLDSEGKPLNRNSPAQENGMPADTFARKLLRKMKSSHFHHYIGGKELLAVPLHGLAPKLFYRLLGGK